MNVIKMNGTLYKYEFYWRDSKNEIIYDSKDNEIPFPVHSDVSNWTDKLAFIQNLKESQRRFISLGKFKLLDVHDYKDCLLCGKKNVVTGMFSVNGLRWMTGVAHYINKHNIKPSDEFIDFIYRSVNSLHKKSYVVGRLKGFNV